jgi:hypothetical protein
VRVNTRFYAVLVDSAREETWPRRSPSFFAEVNENGCRAVSCSLVKRITGGWGHLATLRKGLTSGMRLWYSSGRYGIMSVVVFADAE